MVVNINKIKISDVLKFGLFCFSSPKLFHGIKKLGIE